MAFLSACDLEERDLDSSTRLYLEKHSAEIAISCLHSNNYQTDNNRQFKPQNLRGKSAVVEMFSTCLYSEIFVDATTSSVMCGLQNLCDIVSHKRNLLDADRYYRPINGRLLGHFFTGLYGL